MFSVEYLGVCVECSVFRGHGRGVGVKEMRVRVWCQGLGGSEEGSYLRPIDCVSLNSRLESNKEEEDSVEFEGFVHLVARGVGNGLLHLE